MNQSKIFISYSHQGNGLLWKERLIGALNVFERQHLLDVWHDEEMALGKDWHEQINASMKSAKLAVLLLTDEMLKSTFVLRHEFPELERRHKEEGLIIAPILCEKCDWRVNEWITSLQIKPRVQTDPTPLAALSDRERDSALRNIATEIAEHISHIALAVLPKPDKSPSPDHIYLDKFPIADGPGLHEHKLIGREQELALLDLAFAQGRTAITTLVAWGGVGKTMLVQHWLKRLQNEDWYGVRCVYAWSFYSQGTTEDRQASEDTFLAHALEWFGVQCEPTLSPWDKGRLLAQAVVNEPTLLILDGIEPLQYPPGPMGGQLRAPGVQSLLKHLARNPGSIAQPGLCLVTTREPLTDLSDFERRPDASLGSVLRLDLGNLNDDAGAALLHHVGVKRAGAAEINDNDKELREASSEVDGHALTLNLLGRFLARAYGGDVRCRDLVKFDEADRTLQGGTTFKMLAAFENWFANEGDIEARALAILRMLGLFDRPADSGCLSALREPPVIAGLTDPLFVLKRDSNSGEISEQALSDKGWNDAIHFLIDFGLVVSQNDEGEGDFLLDCHPLIREYFSIGEYRQGSESWKSANRRLYRFFYNNTSEQPTRLEEIELLYRCVTHGCAAKLYQETFDDVLEYRIRKGSALYSIKTFGVFGSHLIAITNFFEVPWSKLEPEIDINTQALLLNEVGFCLRALGRFEEAIEPFRKSYESAISVGNFDQGATYLSNLSELNLSSGMIDIAETNADLSVSFSNQSGDMRRFRRDLAVLADSIHQSGGRAQALSLFAESEKIQGQIQPQIPLLYSTSGFRFNDLLMSEMEQLAWKKYLLRSQFTMEKSYRVDNHLMKVLHDDVLKRAKNGLYVVLNGSRNLQDIALNYLTLARCTFFADVIGIENAYENQIVEFFTEAEKGLRRAGTEHYIPLVLLSKAWFTFMTMNQDDPLNNLDEAWDIASRGPMRLHMADIHLYRARLFFREGHYPWESPQADLEAAEKLINECGYHRRDEELADAKKVILGL